MNSNTNEKIIKVSENTLVVGIDIAKRKHFACALDDRDRVLQIQSFNRVLDLKVFMRACSR